MCVSECVCEEEGVSRSLYQQKCEKGECRQAGSRGGWDLSLSSVFAFKINVMSVSKHFCCYSGKLILPLVNMKSELLS